MRQLVTFFFFIGFTLSTYAEEFELFVVDSDLYAQPGVTVYQVNGGDRLMAEINTQLKRDGVTREEDGEAYVTQAFKEALANQAIGLVKAAKYQLSYFPALVIDRRFVVYGTTSVNDYYRLKKSD